MTPRQWAVVVLTLVTVAAVGEWLLAWLFGVDTVPVP